MSQPVVISLVLLKSRLFDLGIPIETINRGLTSQRYALPTKAWIVTTFGRYWSVLRGQYFKQGYERGDSVCHHYAQGCSWAAGRCHAATATKPDDAALCFGELWYVRADGVNHAINFALTPDGEEPPRLVCFEPQTSLEVRLSTEDLNRCDFVRV